MNKKMCVICENGTPCYKCPTCAASTCSLDCSKRHVQLCKPSEPANSGDVFVIDLEGEDINKVLVEETAEKKRLQKLKNSADLKNLLKDESLRKALFAIDASKTPGVLLEKAMKSNDNVQQFASLSQAVLNDEHIESTNIDQSAMDAFAKLLKNAIDP